MQSGRVEEAISWLEQTDAVASQAVAELPALVEFREGAAGGLALLADAYAAKERYTASVPVGERATQLLSQLTRELPDRSDLWAQQGQTWGTLARAHAALKESSQAITAFESAIAAFVSAARLDPENTDYVYAQAVQWIRLGRLLAESGDQEAARARTQEGKRILESLQQRNPVDKRVQKLLESLQSERA